MMRYLLMTSLILVTLGCGGSKPKPEGEPNLPKVGSPPPPPAGMINTKAADYTKGITNPK